MFPYVTSLILDGKGRIVIPARVRESLNLKPGDVVKLEFLGNVITLNVEGNGENEN